MTSHRVTGFTAPDEGELTQLTVADRVIAVASTGGRLAASPRGC